MFPFRSMFRGGPKPVRSDSDPPPSDFPGLERLDRPELDEDAPRSERDERAENDGWQDESAVRHVSAASSDGGVDGKPACSA